MEIGHVAAFLKEANPRNCLGSRPALFAQRSMKLLRFVAHIFREKLMNRLLSSASFFYSYCLANM